MCTWLVTWLLKSNNVKILTTLVRTSLSDIRSFRSCNSSTVLHGRLVVSGRMDAASSAPPNLPTSSCINAVWLWSWVRSSSFCILTFSSVAKTLLIHMDTTDRACEDVQKLRSLIKMLSAKFITAVSTDTRALHYITYPQLMTSALTLHQPNEWIFACTSTAK